MYDKQSSYHKGDCQSGRHELRGKVRRNHGCAAPRQEEKPYRGKARGNRKRVRPDIAGSPWSRGENDCRRNFYQPENKGQTDPDSGTNLTTVPISNKKALPWEYDLTFSTRAEEKDKRERERLAREEHGEI